MKVVRWLVLALAFAIAFGTVKFFYEEYRRNQFNANLAEAERLVNQGLPKKMNDYTTWVRTKLHRKETAHYYRLDTDDNSVDLPIEFRNSVKAQSCATKATADEINSGVVHSFNYVNRQGKHLNSFSVATCR